jgi:cyclopropane fatty-acyl-phospholipid synthase-like methyltransferase
MKYFVTTVLAAFIMASSMAQEHRHHHHQHGSGHSANEHMHQSSTADLIKRFESPERDAYQQPDKVVAWLGKLKGKTIMDIGAGSGYFSVRLAAAGARVIAADVNDEFQAFVQRRIAENKLANIRTRKIPYDSPGLEPAEVDMVLMVNTYHHIDNRTDYFAQVRKGTKAKGSLVIIDFFKTDLPVGPGKDHKTSIDEVITELRQAGYTKFDVDVSLLPYQYLIKAR